MALCQLFNQVGASILNADLSRLADEVNSLVADQIDFIHFDVMDGHFVEDISFGSMVLSHLRSISPRIFYDVHMMVERPWLLAKKMGDAGADRITFHYETLTSDNDYIELRDKIHVNAVPMGIAINPATDVQEVIDMVKRTCIKPDCFLVMTVVPGKGGQKLMPECLEKVKVLRKVYGPQMNIEVDGGVNMSNVKMCIDAGANLIVSGTGIIGQQDRNKVIRDMRDFFPKYDYAADW